MIVFVTLILTTGGVMILRPIAKQLSAYLQVVTEQKRVPNSDRALARLQESLATIDERLTMVEERQNFSEQLLQGRESAALLGSIERRP